MGAPLEQVETVLQRVDTDEEVEEEAWQAAGHEASAKLRPLAVSLLERSIGPFRVADANASADEEWLRVSA